jgi:hypothetical protein
VCLIKVYAGDEPLKKLPRFGRELGLNQRNRLAEVQNSKRVINISGKGSGHFGYSSRRQAPEDLHLTFS